MKIQDIQFAHTDYYDDIKNRLIKDEGNKYGFHFGDEDFYIYFTAHAYKHYKEGGTGFKTLTDFFVLNKSYGDTLDRKYINTELDKLGIRDFENDMRLLSEKLFKYGILNQIYIADYIADIIIVEWYRLCLFGGIMPYYF